MDTPSTTTDKTRISRLQEQVKESSLPPDLEEKVTLMLQQADTALRYGNIAALESAERYVSLVVSLPWNKVSVDNLDLASVRKSLDKHHYGMIEVKERIIEYLSILKLQLQKAQAEGKSAVEMSRAPIMCFVGLVGTGKTTFAYSIAEAMGRKIVRIPFGGMGSALELRGQSRIHPDAEPGHIIKALQRSKTRNPVILLDEVDRVSEDARNDIMGVLVELLDPEQNVAFTDHFLDYPFNLLNVLFVATANNTKNITTAVLDRLEPIQMPSYSDNEKISIGRDYILPRQLENTGLTPQQLVIDPAVWQKIVRPTGFDAGIRTLERTLNQICRKSARLIIEQKYNTVRVTPENISKFVEMW
ncbi:MAG TPA: AAA family ATPase [Patescibacteria group bacterium]|nr:AAA family ATPase [Patescibacteria group bacterium]